MLVHCRITPGLITFAGSHLYPWVERGTVRIKWIAQEHKAIPSARARIRAARCGVERTKNEVTAPLSWIKEAMQYSIQSELANQRCMKPKSKMTCSTRVFPPFPCLARTACSALNSDWFIRLSDSAVIGQMRLFGVILPFRRVLLA